MSEQQGEKSFEPTEQRRTDFRKRGKFARAKDASGVIATAAVLGVLLGSRLAMVQSVRYLFLRSHGDLSAIARQDTQGVVEAALAVLAVIAVPAAVASAIGATAASLAQAGFHPNFEGLSFKPERLNPFPQLGQIFSPKKGTVQAILSVVRVGVVGYVAYRALIIELPDLLTLGRVGVESAASRLIDAAVRVLVSALFALAAVALIDYAQSKFTLEREMKMTRKEVMDESRSQDGDPKLKGRMRARARALARRRSIDNVKTASVVVSNPTHISVALRYSATDPAPIVVAKGHDDVALQIRTEARKYGIPILENRPLARALDAEVAIGQTIPAAHFAAVARILAFVFRVRGENPARHVRRPPS
jgi:flagellar biosynthesis protein FlhB